MILGLVYTTTVAQVGTLPLMLATLTELGIKDSDEVLDGVAVTGADIFAISTMFAGIIPEMVVGGAGGNLGFVAPLVVPLNLPGMAQGIVPSYHIHMTSAAELESEEITVGVEHGIPIGKRFHYSKKNDTGDTTGTEMDMSKPNKNMVALLMHATTVPTTANVNRDIKEIKIIIAGKEEYHFNWFELGHGKCPQDLLDDTVSGPILDNWRIIIFPHGGIPAGNLVAWTVSAVATTEITFIGIYQ